MKKTITFVVCLASVIGVLPAIAQTGSTIKVTLPYAISVGSITLPAGECTITDLQNQGHETLFQIRSDAGPAAEVFMERTELSGNQEAPAAAVQLRHVGNNYEIEGIRMDGMRYQVN